MKDISKALLVFLIGGGIIAYWNPFKGALVDVEGGVIRLSSLLDIEPLSLILIGVLVLAFYLSK
jgi:hypothetical protein